MKKSNLAICAIVALVIAGCRQNNGELQFNTITYNDSVTTPAITYLFDGRMEVPSDGLTAGIRKILRHEILLYSLGENYATLKDSKVLKAYSDSSYNEYNSLFAETLEPLDAETEFRITCETRISGAVSFASERLLNYETCIYSYSGGAHGIYRVTNNIFDLNTGMTITEMDIFGNNADEPLHGLLAEAATSLRKDSILPADTDLFGDDLIVANGNVELVENGLSYIYNPYEIAPYVYGVIRVPLDNAKVLPLLNKECPVYDYIAGKTNQQQ